MNNELIERYLYAVTKRLPRTKREDVALELRGLVEDMLTERCQGRIPEERDIRVVLTELGTPQELYAQYDEDAEKCLIGQPYFSTYKFVLKVVLLSVTAGLTIANLILGLMEQQEFFTVVTGWLNSLWNSLFGAFSFVTLLFAFFQRKGIRLSESFDFDNLPPVPKHSREISKWESIAGICFDVIFVVLFLLTPEVFSVWTDGMRIQMFDPEALRGCTVPILLFAACGIVREAVQLLEKEYTGRVMTVALVSDGISALLAVWWLRGHKLLNPAFLGQMNSIFAGESEFLRNLFADFQVFFLGCIFFALVLDAVDVTVKTLRK